MIGWKACRRVNGGYKKFETGGIGGSVRTEFEIGQTYTVNGRPELCRNGFHFYSPEDFVFGMTLFGSDTAFIEIAADGEVVSDTEKHCCSTIRVLRYVPKKELLRRIGTATGNAGDYNTGDYNSGHCNSGKRNSGNYNSGNYNSGDSNTGVYNSGDGNTGSWNTGGHNSGARNSGDWNSGDGNSGIWNSGNWNSGHRNRGDRNSGNGNSGDWNSGHCNAGYFNVDAPDTVRVFGRDCLRSVWDNAEKPAFLFFEIRDGESYKQAFSRAYNDASGDERKQLEALPNFDWEIFSEISGVPVPDRDSD